MLIKSHENHINNFYLPKPPFVTTGNSHFLPINLHFLIRWSKKNQHTVQNLTDFANTHMGIVEN